ncbi:hypothetical protein D1114_23210 [Cereibacter sphaeroides]|uniref:Uncharacterized protein n=1 Tax=Cereibacter sphaeroides TaxID=1063 RepID=A0AAX1UEC9_CERSP|nr:hypothetical protein D1114_23210 [Cereibacter sphaeroides]
MIKENLPKLVAAAGATLGSVGAITAVSSSGAVSGLGAVGITSGLATVGGVVGGGMATGLVITAAAPLVVGGAALVIFKAATRKFGS